jgi:ppGpp synthetase/RelA/SpoT-type nucleotidyltranferase
VAIRLSKTQVDRLGDRLRQGAPVESDLRLLDDYRRSFGEAYETVVRVIGEQLRLEPTGRSAKSTTSVLEKLQRESIRLTQVQDIAGCRIVVSNLIEQDRVVATLRTVFTASSVADRRENPSHGYRAVHVVVQISNRLVEVQVRSTLQHLWAELSEKLSDLLDPAIKYGRGDQQARNMLSTISEMIALGEAAERAIAQQLEETPRGEQRALWERLKLQMDRIRDTLGTAISEAIVDLVKRMEGNQ